MPAGSRIHERQGADFLTDDDEKLVQSFNAGGIRGSAARILVYLYRHPGATTREIERGVDMSQPQLSNCISPMKKQGSSLYQGKRKQWQLFPVFPCTAVS